MKIPGIITPIYYCSIPSAKLVPTLVKKLLNALAISLLSVISTPSMMSLKGLQGTEQPLDLFVINFLIPL